MMAVRSILLILALTDAAAGLFYREYHEHETDLSWTDAYTHCRNNDADLAIIDTESEYEIFIKQTKNLSDKHWIGLRKNPGDSVFTQWTYGTALNVTKWKSEKPDPSYGKDCAFIESQMWDNDECTQTMKSFCFTWAPKMIVVLEMKNWEEALVHCRTFYTDLLSLTSETDYFLVNNRSSDIQTPTFWTSLHFMAGSWFWVDLGYPESLTSLPSCPVRPFWCGARNTETGVWENRDCEEKMNFICYHYK